MRPGRFEGIGTIVEGRGFDPVHECRVERELERARLCHIPVDDEQSPGSGHHGAMGDRHRATTRGGQARHLERAVGRDLIGPGRQSAAEVRNSVVRPDAEEFRTTAGLGIHGAHHRVLPRRLSGRVVDHSLVQAPWGLVRIGRPVREPDDRPRSVGERFEDTHARLSGCGGWERPVARDLNEIAEVDPRLGCDVRCVEERKQEIRPLSSRGRSTRLS